MQSCAPSPIPPSSTLDNAQDSWGKPAVRPGTQEADPIGLLSRASAATTLPVSKSRYQGGLDGVQRLSIGEDGNRLIKSGNTGRGPLGGVVVCRRPGGLPWGDVS